MVVGVSGQRRKEAVATRLLEFLGSGCWWLEVLGNGGRRYGTGRNGGGEYKNNKPIKTTEEGTTKLLTTQTRDPNLILSMFCEKLVRRQSEGNWRESELFLRLTFVDSCLSIPLKYLKAEGFGIPSPFEACPKMMAGKKQSLSADSDNLALHKEWDEASCPICMEHPHNAVLLLCSSHEKGCRPYICDTSYRHSNCLDRYRKLKMDSDPEQLNSGSTSASQAGDGLAETQQPRGGESSRYDDGATKEEMDLKCPLCRGHVHGWKVVEETREHLNLKVRNCSRESCSFVGDYSELRRHARSLHPSARPAEIDPSRQRAWRRFEHQREYDDIVSAIQSAIPGAVMFGDYVIENGNNDRIPATERGRAPGDRNEPLWTTFVLFQMFGSTEARNRPRRTWSRHRSSGRRYIWGENLLGVRNESGRNDGEHNMGNASSDNLPARRRRRRLTRTRFSTDRP
ncbi:hypothetical protein V2J09_022007 [Rumex salicifolius]